MTTKENDGWTLIYNSGHPTADMMMIMMNLDLKSTCSCHGNCQISHFQQHDFYGMFLYVHTYVNGNNIDQKHVNPYLQPEI